ncbi:UDP-N-acetylmuramate dehydrogenase [Andreprevotia lacus DSM 23236]|jgi:UDP-N-acetylmuramate dehydrogenase|uniref:UDP-N-acetylenolpyruvoylglucosamine reductase n=1 Tax=Andreprevotia lacus DSM 23236 TaxID=1121001 RepID=A0A1W1XXF3_9NEIS|nr:UDP-N-acetylmuramate dehydrogenase [Andreprevotia lacus]SMC28649.1 UDP-N-acetylmuramate dehydrogenase [Andreprevotia lacus DSM 23236]
MTAIHTDAALTSLNTLGLTASAARFATVREHADLLQLLADATLRAQLWHVLGGGSNLVLPERVEGLTVQVAVPGRRLLREDDDAYYVAAGGGENWHDFVQWTLAQGWGGLENLSLIPGTVGAAPIQNIGAYGVEVKDRLFALTAWSLQDGAPRVFSNAECAFAYRDSIFKQAEAGRWLIAEVVFRLPKNAPLVTGYGDLQQEIAAQGLPLSHAGVAQAVMAVRRRKLPDPAQIGNAGSFFKNPIIAASQRDALLQQFPQLVSYPAGEGLAKLAAGWLIEQAGWKGRRLGPVGMYEKQALVLVNHGGAARADVAALTAAVQGDVAARFGVQLEAEPVWW